MDQILDLTPTTRVQYEHHQLVRRLEEHLDIVRAERDEHKSECKSHIFEKTELIKDRHLLDKKIVRMETAYAHSGKTDVFIAILQVCGGALISSYSSGPLFGVGWSFLLMGLILQSCRAFLHQDI